MGRDATIAIDRPGALGFMAPTESGFQQMVRFGIVGAVATALDYAVLLTLYRFAHAPNLVAVAGGYIVGLALSYVFSIAWVFSHRSVSNKHLEFAIFAVIGVIGLVLTEIVILLSLHWLQSQPVISAGCGRFIQAWVDRCFAVIPGLSSRSMHITVHASQIIVAKSVAVVLVFFFNFWARKFVLFAAPRRAALNVRVSEHESAGR